MAAVVVEEEEQEAGTVGGLYDDAGEDEDGGRGAL